MPDPKDLTYAPVLILITNASHGNSPFSIFGVRHAICDLMAGLRPAYQITNHKPDPKSLAVPQLSNKARFIVENVRQYVAQNA